MAEAGHHAGRAYFGQDGNVYLNGAALRREAGATGDAAATNAASAAVLIVRDEAVSPGGVYGAAASSVAFGGAAASVAAVDDVAIHLDAVIDPDNTGCADLITWLKLDTPAACVGNKAAKLLVCSADVTGGGGAAAAGLQVKVNGTQYWLPLYAI